MDVHHCTNFKPDDIGVWRCVECGAYEGDVIEYDDDNDQDMTCPHCSGTGLDFDGLEECEYCDGMGYKWWL